MLILQAIITVRLHLYYEFITNAYRLCIAALDVDGVLILSYSSPSLFTESGIVKEYSKFAHASVHDGRTQLDSYVKASKKAKSRHSGLGAYAKRLFDFSSSLGALIFLSPMILMVTMLLLISQGRPILIKHRRVGRNGKSFGCLKFRTMVVNAEAVLQDYLATSPALRAEWDATHKLKNDPRITPLGKALRKSSLDELPQLLNIVRGDMSVVGPRPIVQDEVKHYGNYIADYTKVRPGLTGLWQVSGRSDVSYKHRVLLDVTYVKNWKFSNDMMIILKTVPAVLNSAGSY